MEVIEEDGIDAAFAMVVGTIGGANRQRIISWVELDDLAAAPAAAAAASAPDSVNILGSLTLPADTPRDMVDVAYGIDFLAISILNRVTAPYRGDASVPRLRIEIYFPDGHQIITSFENNDNTALAGMMKNISDGLRESINESNQSDRWSGINLAFFNDIITGQYVELSLQIKVTPALVLRDGRSFNELLNQDVHENYGPQGVLVPRNADSSCVWYALAISYLYYICYRDGSERRSLFNTSQRRDGVVIEWLKQWLQEHDVMGKEVVERAIRQGETEFEEAVRHFGGIPPERFMSLEQAEKFFTEALEKMIPDRKERDRLCLQVFIIKRKANGETSSFPAFFGPNRTRDVDRNSFIIVNFISERAESAHYVVPTTLERRFGIPGKVKTDFWVCQKCGLICFTRSVLLHHVCQNRDGSISYGWNDRPTCEEVARNPEADIFAEGHCNGCRLSFSSGADHEYHCNSSLGGCFTSSHAGAAGLRGYRHVVLSNGRHLLEGIDCDGDRQYAATENAAVCAYADFESVIDPERNNEHRLLYWGIYVERSPVEAMRGVYTDGRSIVDFLNFLKGLVPANRGRAQRRDEAAKRVIVWFHNGSGYDFNFIFRELMNNPVFKDWRISGNLRGANKWQQMKVRLPEESGGGQIMFKDTFQFLTLSLAKLVACSKSDPRVFVKYHEQLRRRYGEERMTREMCEVVTQKNSLPYTYFTDEGKLSEPMSAIMGTLSAAEQQVAITLRFRTTEDWLRLYLMSDVLLLRCVFERAREQLRETHHVLFDRYVGLPSTTWHAWIKSLAMLPEAQRPVIPLFNSDSEALFFKRMVRGGVTCASKRYAISDEEHTILYLDVNGLYPHVMRRPFPAGDLSFAWMTREALDTVCALTHHDFVERVCQIWKNKHTWDWRGKRYAGGAFEVDMHLPEELHDHFAQFPLAPEHVEITEDLYEDNVYLKTAMPGPDDKERKNSFKGLACTLWPKRRYQVHWRVLRWYIRQGMVVDKVYCMTLWTEERSYLKEYVELNMRLRDQHRDELTRTLYKLMGNSLYGKTFENPFNHTGVSVISTDMKLYGLIEQGRIHSIIYTGANGTLAVNEGERVVLDKPTYIGAIVLEYAKLHMYKLFYEKLDRAFPIDQRRMELLYTDTDSFVLRVQHPPDWRPAGTTNISRILEHINSSLAAAGKKAVIGTAGGLTKSETGEDDYIAEFCALRAKSYAYRTAAGKENVRAKGTTHEAQERELDIEKYKRVLRDNGVLCLENQRIARTHFELRSVVQLRVALSANDGKRWICEDGINTLPFGHYSLSHAPPSH